MTDTAALLRAEDRVVFEGDSQTSRRRNPNADNWAFLRLANWHRTYAELVEEWLFTNLPELGLSFRHAAIGGSTIAGMEQRYDQAVRPHEPNLLIFTIGNNDAAHMSVGEFGERLAAYLDRLQADCGSRLLYIGNFEACPPRDPAVVERCGKVKPYNLAAAELVTARRGTFLDIGPALRRKAEKLYAQSTFHTVYAEGRHLNLLGAHILAGQVLRTLGAYALLDADRGT